MCDVADAKVRCSDIITKFYSLKSIFFFFLRGSIVHQPLPKMKHLALCLLLFLSCSPATDKIESSVSKLAACKNSQGKTLYDLTIDVYGQSIYSDCPTSQVFSERIDSLDKQIKSRWFDAIEKHFLTDEQFVTCTCESVKAIASIIDKSNTLKLTTSINTDFHRFHLYRIFPMLITVCEDR